jgi:hypothetical protein
VTGSIKRKTPLDEFAVVERWPQLRSNFGIAAVGGLDRVRLASRRDHRIAGTQQLLACARARADRPREDGNPLLLARMYMHWDNGRTGAHCKIERQHVLSDLAPGHSQTQCRRLDLLPEPHVATLYPQPG